MNKLKSIVLVLIIAVILISCDSSGKEPATEAGFTEIENGIKDKFGNNAYFTELTISYNKSIGNIISVIVTKAPNSLKMGRWDQSQGNWNQNQDITIEVPKGSKPSDFMFQLDEKINLPKLGKLIEKSTNKLTTENNIKNPTLNMAFVKFPNNGDISKAEYVIMLNPENGETTFTIRYTLNGDFIEINN